jgi:hypothetical protein
VADFVKVQGVAAANIVKIDGITASSVVKVDGCTTPSSGASRLVASMDDAYVSWVNIADEAAVATWENNTYEAGASGDSWDITDIAAGKDGSGAEFYVAVVNGNNPEIIHDDDADITDGTRWSEINLGASNQPVGNLKQRTVLWGNNVWVTAGLLTSSNQYIYRSTNGTSWAAIDISGLTDIGSVYTSGIYALTSNGTGTWWFGIKGKIYKSTDNASSWDLDSTISGATIWDLAYTNDTLVCLYLASGAKLITAAAADTTDWGTAVALVGSSNASLSANNTKRMAAGAGRVVCIDTGNSLAADVSGKTITIQGTRQALPDEGNLNCICTDGSGNFWAGSDGGTTGPDGGDICKSTDNGLSWSKIAEGIAVSGNRKIEGITTNVYLPV